MPCRKTGTAVSSLFLELLVSRKAYRFPQGGLTLRKPAIQVQGIAEKLRWWENWNRRKGRVYILHKWFWGVRRIILHRLVSLVVSCAQQPFFSEVNELQKNLRGDQMLNYSETWDSARHTNSSLPVLSPSQINGGCWRERNCELLWLPPKASAVAPRKR